MVARKSSCAWIHSNENGQTTFRDNSAGKSGKPKSLSKEARYRRIEIGKTRP